DVDVAANVREVVPAVGSQLRYEVGGASAFGPTRLPLPPEVRQVVERPGQKVVVRAQHEPRRQATAHGVDRGNRGLDRLGFGQEVAGDHGDGRGRQAGEERGFAPIAADEVQVRQVEHGQ